MSRCVACNNVIEDTFSHLISMSKICYCCLKKYKYRFEKFLIKGIEVLVLYYYNDFYKDILFRYKGCYDYALKDVFLVENIDFLKRKYKGYSLVLAPSSKESENKRGFNHLEEIFKCLKMPIIKCCSKSNEWKQSEKKYVERSNIQKIIKIDKSCLKGLNKVLIVDDVLTSGSTIKSIIKQIPASINKKVLILASNCRIKANEIV